MEKNVYIFKINEEKLNRTLFSIIMNLDVLTNNSKQKYELTKEEKMYIIKTDSTVAANIIIDEMEFAKIQPTNKEIETTISFC